MVLDEILLVRQMFCHHLVVAAVTQHHQPSHDRYRLPA